MTRRGVLRAVGLLLLVVLPWSGLVEGQQSSLAREAERARAALARGDMGALLSTARAIQLQLPSGEPSGAVSPAQAAAVLRPLLGRGAPLRVTVGRFREVGEGRGYVELYREVLDEEAPGAGGGRRQQVLLGYRRDGGGWILVEIRVN